MPDIPQAQFALTAMTLRGDGSYLHGARLDIKPLTILCGANGSGKSTWFKSFELLRQWSRSGYFPFPQFDGNYYGQLSDHTSLTHDFTNAFVKADSDPNFDEDTEYEEFGQIGTIALHFSATSQFVLDVPRDSVFLRGASADTIAQQLLWEGRVPKGMLFRLRVAHPSHFDDLIETPNTRYESQIELCCGSLRLFFHKEAGQDKFAFSCSPAFHLYGADDSSALDTIAVVETNHGSSEGVSVQQFNEREFTDYEETICNRTIALIQSIFKSLETSWFYIGAVRHLHDYGDVDLAPDSGNGNEPISQSDMVYERRVGAHGEATLSVERTYSFNQMCERSPPWNGRLSSLFTADDIVGGFARIAEFANREVDRATAFQRRVWNLTAPEVRECVTSLVGVTDDSDDIPESSLFTLSFQTRSAIAALLNQVLERNDLFNSQDWPSNETDIADELRTELESALIEYIEGLSANGDETTRFALLTDSEFCELLSDSEEAIEELSVSQTVAKILICIINQHFSRGHHDHNIDFWLRDLRRIIDAPLSSSEASPARQRVRDSLRAYLDFPLPGVEAERLLRRGVSTLCKSDLHRFNRLLLEAGFRDDDLLAGRKHAYTLGTYVSYWLRKLLNTDIYCTDPEGSFARVSLGELWDQTDGNGPSGYLRDLQPRDINLQRFPARWKAELSFYETSPTSTERFTHHCGGRLSPQRPFQPRRLSAGFHQVLPAIVQTGVMLGREILALENPEAHLHPSLQLKMTEFLIQQAKAGKHLIIETHSDLVVRRVLRAILAEEIAQSQVAIYFADIEKEEHGYHYSTLTTLEINEQGQIANWPEGFMDDDVKESRRLMDAMYGRRPEGDEDQEP